MKGEKMRRRKRLEKMECWTAEEGEKEARKRKRRRKEERQ